MRRGHAGIGGWRNENSRHFMPRSGGPPHFRHSARNFHLLDTPRFSPPGPRPPRPSVPFTNHPNQIGNRPDHHDRNKYRQDNRQSTQYRPPDRSHHQSQRSMFPFLDSHNSFYANSPRESRHINRLGDIDHRQQGNKQNSSDHYGRPPISPWAIPPENQRAFYDERNKYNKQHNKYHDNVESSKMPVLDYPGHRPPASDHYGGNPSSSIDNSHSFSRSVDDTVDIVRKRLQNRSEPQPLSEHIDHHDEDLRIPNSNSGNFNNIVQEQPKKRMQRQKLDKNVESNCDKMKSKIVQQLFKMDKDRIHKLMDNPSSSTKFEYAISSLITESQNSLNKHLRSVAEKSLSSSEDFINNDNNTIYEDTFMKQMQHILEPQDTVLLEDIKPLVLAELSKVLQLNEYDHPFQVVDGQQNYHQIPDQHGSYGSMETHNYEDYSNSQNAYYDSVETPPVGYEDYGNSTTDLSLLDYDPPEPEKPVVLYERRNTRKNSDYRPEPTRPEPTFSPVKELSTEQPNNNVCLTREDFPPFPHDNRSTRQSIDRRQSEDKSKEPEIQAPLFDANCTQISEDDDPFAELDNQYHVAVDPNFLDMDTFGMSSPQLSRHSSRSSSNNRELSNSARTPNKDTVNIKQEFDNQNSQHSISSSRLKLTSSLSMNQNSTTENTTNCNTPVKKEVFTPTKDNTNFEIQSNIDIQPECNTDSNIKKQLESSLNVNTSPKPMVPSSSRKRSIDQKPAHRKEKRKKSETSPSDSSHKAKNKDTPTTPVVDDCATKDREKYTESAKSIFKMFFSKNENSKEVHKDTKKADSADKSYSDKYVKRKETHKKTKEDDQKKRQRSLSTSHSTVSPKDSTNNNNTQSSKTKLQSIDMFLEQPKKITNKHQPHRNTAKAPNTPTKTVEVTKPKPLIPFNRKITKRHVSTQVVYNKTIEKETQTIENKNCTSRLCKPDKKKTLVKGVQTDPVSFIKPPSKATDAFERMKEIDMEIQVLLQEKFKLYSSLESNSACPSTIQTLGMTVLNVPLNEVTETDEHNSENSLSGDAIVDDFTNIPVEELEQIALESVEDPETPVVEKKTRRHKISEESRASSASPTVKRSARKALKTPNISLLEQIITDDRPLEDIISLDDLETTPVKSKKKAKQPKKKGNKKAALKINKTPLTTVNEYGLKECYVVLQRDDLSRYFKTRFDDAEQNSIITVESYSPSPVMENPVEIIEKSHETVFNVSDIVEETVVENDVQFDMLDVSEDIVIGEMCEMKSEDKEVERTESVTEDIILDNSQSAVEPARSEGVQSENICKMYDYSTDESLRRDAVTVSGHADAVLAIECVENNFVAACLDGNVYHFNGDGQLLSTLRGSNLAVTCLTIVKEKYGTTVYTGSLDSRIRYYDLETGLEKGPECNVLSPIQTMDRAWDTIFVGTRTGFVLQFECKNNMLIPVSTVKFSDQSILALRAMKEGPRKVLLVAARSEDVTIKDAQTGLLLRSLQGPKMTVYTLLYEDGKVYCGTSSHLVHVFDYASGSHVGAHEGGKGAVCLRGAGGLVFAGCYDGCVYVFRDGEPRALAQLRGPSLMLLSLAVQGTKIIAGYKDRSLYIWKIPLSILQEMIL